MEVAMDYALNCSPDHPWVREHPEWFHHRPDGSIAYAENPPKKYQDIYPLNFWPPDEADRVALWEACKAIIDFWSDRGDPDLPGGQPAHQAVRLLGVDDQRAAPGPGPTSCCWPKRSPGPRSWPDWPRSGSPRATRISPGGSPSTGQRASRTYVEELAHGPAGRLHAAELLAQHAGYTVGPAPGRPPAAFALRFVLAATLSPSYGVYSGYELCENQPASADNEEYMDSEKFEIKHRDFARPGTLAPLFGAVNAIRRRHRAFASLRSCPFPRL